MENFLASIVAGSDMQKGVFLMVMGIAFVFIVQTLFYLFIKAFVRKKKE
jgi:Na+-transporting methylmalonyl-CoA/oxaloacetate decarboxylase gamma subunit